MDPEPTRRECERCNKVIIKFSKTTDWISRKYHKTCWQEKVAEFARQELFEQLKDYS